MSFSQVGIGGDSTGTVVTVDAAAKTALDLPFTTDWIDSGGTVSYAYSATVASTVAGKRYTLTAPAPRQPVRHGDEPADSHGHVSDRVPGHLCTKRDRRRHHRDGCDSQRQSEDRGRPGFQRLVRERCQHRLHVQRSRRQHDIRQAVCADDAVAHSDEPIRRVRGGDCHGDLQGPVRGQVRTDRHRRRFNRNGCHGQRRAEDRGKSAVHRLVRPGRQRLLCVRRSGCDLGDWQALCADHTGAVAGEPGRGVWRRHGDGHLQSAVPGRVHAKRDWRGHD